MADVSGQTSVVQTWTSGSASASITVKFYYKYNNDSSTQWTFQLYNIDSSTSTTGSGDYLEAAKNKRRTALDNGLTVRFYFNGSDIVSGIMRGDNRDITMLSSAYNTRTISKTHSSQNISIYGYFKGKAGTTYTVTISAKPSYSITYNGNGGSTPAAATKWYGENLSLASSTRSGYNFYHWNTANNNSGTTYSSPYTENAAKTLYAIWSPIFTLNKNGGTGTILGATGTSNATLSKTYGGTATLPTSGLSRQDYSFKGWNASSSATTVRSNTIGTSENTSTTFYAVWDRTYDIPKISIASIERCQSNGTLDPTGTYVKVVINWLVYMSGVTVNNITASYSINNTSYSNSSGAITSNIIYEKTLSEGGAWNTTELVLGNSTDLTPELTPLLTVVITDNKSGTNSATGSIPKGYFPIDILRGGQGIAFGGAATQSGIMDIVNYDVLIRQNLFFNNINSSQPLTSINGKLYAAITALGWESEVIV